MPPQKPVDAEESPYLEHALLEDEALEKRTYQEVIAAHAAKENVFCVLPTGMGKTAVAALTMAHIVEENGDADVLVMAPTKPLAEQHRDMFADVLALPDHMFTVLTGDTRPKKRTTEWADGRFFFCTPHIVQNDVLNGNVDVSRFDLVVFDEAHRATGEYPYVFIAEQYKKHGNGRVLALTASPGADRDRIEEIADTLGIDAFETRTEDDPDVKPYVQEKDMDWITVSLSEDFERVQRRLRHGLQQRLDALQRDGFVKTRDVTKKDLLNLRGRLGAEASKKQDPSVFQALSTVAAAIKLMHAQELLETQGVKPLYQYFDRLKQGDAKADKRLVNDDAVQDAMAVTEWMVENNKEHPKLAELDGLLEEKLVDGRNAIVFTQYRDTVDLLHDKLERFNPVKFIGQQDDGMSQTEQLDTLDAFRDGEYDVLISTSIGEEGLDIPAVDYVFFYEPVPSAIRLIQRKGRVGRQTRGEIYVLMAEDTRDEGVYWSAKHKEKKMKSVVKQLQGNNTGYTIEPGETEKEEGSQQTLETFNENRDGEAVQVYVDDRETRVAKQLMDKPVTMETERLDIGDFIVSQRCVVERKTANDFVSSIIDNRLFDQLKAVRNQFDKPVLIVEGRDLFGQRNMHPNAIRGALATVVLDMEIPVLFTEDVADTAETIAALAKREQEDNDRAVAVRGEKTGMNTVELQKFIVAGLPNVSTVTAERLLQHFNTPFNVFTATVDELQDVEGIGEKTAERIHTILRTSHGT